MKPSEASEHLLGQHRRLRELIGAAEAFAARVLAGEAASANLQLTLADLRTTLAEHNGAEETLLEPPTPAVGSPGIRAPAPEAAP